MMLPPMREFEITLENGTGGTHTLLRVSSHGWHTEDGLLIFHTYYFTQKGEPSSQDREAYAVRFVVKLVELTPVPPSPITMAPSSSIVTH